MGLAAGGLLILALALLGYSHKNDTLAQPTPSAQTGPVQGQDGAVDSSDSSITTVLPISPLHVVLSLSRKHTGLAVAAIITLVLLVALAVILPIVLSQSVEEVPVVVDPEHLDPTPDKTEPEVEPEPRFFDNPLNLGLTIGGILFAVLVIGAIGIGAYRCRRGQGATQQIDSDDSEERVPLGRSDESDSSSLQVKTNTLRSSTLPTNIGAPASPPLSEAPDFRSSLPPVLHDDSEDSLLSITPDDIVVLGGGGDITESMRFKNPILKSIGIEYGRFQTKSLKESLTPEEEKCFTKRPTEYYDPEHFIANGQYIEFSHLADCPLKRYNMIFAKTKERLRDKLGKESFILRAKRKDGSYLGWDEVPPKGCAFEAIPLDTEIIQSQKFFELQDLYALVESLHSSIKQTELARPRSPAGSQKAAK